MTDEKSVIKRTEEGRFVKGQSGNPAGRVKGTKNRITLARLMLEENLRATLQGAGPKLLRKAIKMALKGDEKIMRALLDKMLATPRGDDDGAATDRDVKVIIQNLTGPQGPLPAIEGEVIRHSIQGKTTEMSKESNQSRMDQEPTITSKSSGLDYVSAMPNPPQEKSVQRRENSTANDKS